MACTFGNADAHSHMDRVLKRFELIPPPSTFCSWFTKNKVRSKAEFQRAWPMNLKLNRGT